MLTMIRIANASRENVLKAAECGPDLTSTFPWRILLTNSKELAKYALCTSRTAWIFQRVARGEVRSGHRRCARGTIAVNENLSGSGTDRTAESIGKLEEICSVPDVEIFIGPADLARNHGRTRKDGTCPVQENATSPFKLPRNTESW
jgi:hypothetical protein